MIPGGGLLPSTGLSGVGRRDRDGEEGVSSAARQGRTAVAATKTVAAVQARRLYLHKEAGACGRRPMISSADAYFFSERMYFTNPSIWSLDSLPS